MTAPVQIDFSFNVVPGANKLFASWNLGTAPIATSAVISGELIVNDESINEGIDANGYRSSILSDADLRTLRSSTINNVTNGVVYSVILFVYDGETRYMSKVIKVRPQSVPQKPIISCEGTDSAIRVIIDNYYSSAHESNGFAGIGSYDVFYNNVLKTFLPGNNLFIPDLSNNVPYEIAVRAKNVNGLSEFSSTKVATPSSRPLNVLTFTAVVEDEAVVLNWTPPVGMTDNSKYIISRKENTSSYGNVVTLDKMVPAVPESEGVEAVPETPITSYKYEGLNNGSSYSFKIQVYNPTTNVYSEPREIAGYVPYGAPDVPNSVVVALDRTVQITLSRPDNNNGKVVTSYVLNKLQGTVETAVQSTSADPSGNPIYLIDSLTNGVQYSFKAYALNNISPESKSVAKDITATPYSAPGAVTGLTATGGDQQVQLVWTTPTDNGGSPTSLSYEVTYKYISSAVGATPVIESTVTVLKTHPDTSAILTEHLVNGASTTFNVVAYFTINGSKYTSALNSVPCVPFKPPANPTVTAIVDASDNISYSWPLPDLYGLPIKKYMYQYVLSGANVPVSYTDLSYNLLSLVRAPLAYGQAHKLLIKTVTDNSGTSVESTAASEVLFTPYKKPTVVRNLSVYPKQNSLDVVWDPPADAGGYTTIKYKVVVDGNQNTDPITAEKITISGLDDAISHSISVLALGYIGDLFKQASDYTSASGTPYTTANAPSSFSAVPQSTFVELSWAAASASDAGAIKYVIFRDDDNLTTVSGLYYKDTIVTIGRAYVYKVMTQQTWANGYITYSDFIGPITATPYSNPEPVKNLNVSTSDKALSVSWLPLTFADKNGLTTGTVYYEVLITHMSTDPTPVVVTDVDVSQTGVSLTKDNLTNGIKYTVKVTAKIYNSQISADVRSTVETREVTVNAKPAAPTQVSFVPGDGKITVQWYAPADSYTFLKYEFWVNGFYNSESTLNVASGTKNLKDITLSNGVNYVVDIRRVAYIGTLGSPDYLAYSSDPVVSSTLMPFGRPKDISRSILGKTITFSINPNGSKLIQIMVFAGTDKYTTGDQAYQLVQYGSSEPATGTVTKTITLAIADGTVINSVFYAVINAAGATTPV